MSVAAELVGAWRRRSITLDGGPAREPEDVLWLQTPSAFADLRCERTGDPGGFGGRPVEAFAGTTDERSDGTATTLRWHHELDWFGGFAGTDAGAIEWLSGPTGSPSVTPAFLERGTMRSAAGHDVAYVEHWERAGPVGPTVGLRGRRRGAEARFVAVGDWSLLLVRDDGGAVAVRLESPDAGTVEHGEVALLVPRLTWDEDDASASLPRGAFETASKHPVPTVAP